MLSDSYYTTQDWLNLCVLLQTTPGIGPKKFSLITQNNHNIPKLEENFHALTFLPEKIRSELHQNLTKKNYLATIKYCKDSCIELIPYGSAFYPESLKILDDPPFLLFALGNVSRLRSTSTKIAFVGSRKHSDYGDRMTQKIISDLKNTPVTIVSGMALGIDSIAHSAALDSELGTIAVLGSSVDGPIPSESKSLYDRIVGSNSLILSEYAPGATVQKGNFVARNRIVAALSQKVVVIEGDLYSGSLITANIAKKYGIELYALPGQIDKPFSSGPNFLIKSGAVPLLGASDLAVVKSTLNSSGGFGSKPHVSNFTTDESTILELLTSTSELTVDEIAIQTQLQPHKVLTLITQLEIKGAIKHSKNMKYYLS